MKEIKIVFVDVEGNELYSKTLNVYDKKEAIDYAFNVVANGRSNEVNYEIYE